MSNPLEAVTWPVRTERLTVRPATHHDLEATWGFRRLEVVGLWVTQAPATLAEHLAYCSEADRLARTLVIELGGTVIGELMLRVEDSWAQHEVVDRARGVQAELGWVLHPDHAGHGYATEAVQGLIGVCFEQLHLRRVTATCFADNTASWRLMERVGMRREVHSVRDALHRSGAWLDGMSYALLADEWIPPGT